jgi:hypothetical protein
MELLAVRVSLRLLLVLQSPEQAAAAVELTKLEPQVAQEAQVAVGSVELTPLLQMVVTELPILALVAAAAVETIRLLESHKAVTAAQVQYSSNTLTPTH